MWCIYLEIRLVDAESFSNCGLAEQVYNCLYLCVTEIAISCINQFPMNYPIVSKYYIHKKPILEIPIFNIISDFINIHEGFTILLIANSHLTEFLRMLF